MSTERDKLQNDQTRVWELLEQNRDVPESENEIKNLLYQIKSAYIDLMNLENPTKDCYAFLEFCLRYVDIDQNKTYINLEYDVGTTWVNVVENQDFPATLEESLLDAIHKNKMGHVYQVQKMAADFTARENHPKAIRYFQAIGERINNLSGWDNWARSCAAEGDLTRAVEVLTMGIKDYPDAALLTCNRAYYLHQNKKNSQSLKELQIFIERAETDKYADDQFYLYAIKLKASIYQQLDMPLQALIEYSRLSTAGHCDPAFLKENGEALLPHVEALSNG